MSSGPRRLAASLIAVTALVAVAGGVTPAVAGSNADPIVKQAPPTLTAPANDTSGVTPPSKQLTIMNTGASRTLCINKIPLTSTSTKRMTIAYQQAMKDAPSQQRDQLRAAQRLWIQYRDANCLYYGMGEGTIARIDAGECMRNMTKARAEELEGLGHQ